MPWRTEDVESRRGRFVLNALEQECNIAELCREEGISRPTAYKWIKRYKAEGLRGLTDASRKPKKIGNATSAEAVVEVVRIRTEHPTWGSRKIRKILLREKVLKSKEVPCKRTIDRILKRCELVNTSVRRRRPELPEVEIIKPMKANDVWTIDFKGWWYTKDGKKCYPLTVRDEYSRFLIGIFALERPTFLAVKKALIQCFRQYGLPSYIRSDNGQPFMSLRSICGLTKLSTWWLSLGITPNRIAPASPDQNGAHERMHKDLKNELQRNPARNVACEQLRFNRWRHDFNHIRPHEALGDDVPADRYRSSPRRYNEKKVLHSYPVHYEIRKVSAHGFINWKNRPVPISKGLAGECIGLEAVDATTLRLWYTDYCLGVTDQEFKTPIVPAAAPVRRDKLVEAA